MFDWSQSNFNPVNWFSSPGSSNPSGADANKNTAQTDASGESPSGLSGGIGGLMKLVIPMIAMLDKLLGKMTGDEHMFGKMIAGMIPDGVLSVAEKAKLTGMTPDQQQTEKYMADFKGFDLKDPNAPEYKKLDDLAKQQGFEGIAQAHTAASLGFENSAEWRFMATRPEATKAGGVDKFVAAKIQAGATDNAHELAVSMGYKPSDAGTAPAADAAVSQTHSDAAPNATGVSPAAAPSGGAADPVGKSRARMVFTEQGPPPQPVNPPAQPPANNPTPTSASTTSSAKTYAAPPSRTITHSP